MYDKKISLYEYRKIILMWILYVALFRHIDIFKVNAGLFKDRQKLAKATKGKGFRFCRDLYEIKVIKKKQEIAVFKPRMITKGIITGRQTDEVSHKHSFSSNKVDMEMHS